MTKTLFPNHSKTDVPEPKLTPDLRRTASNRQRLQRQFMISVGLKFLFVAAIPGAIFVSVHLVNELAFPAFVVMPLALAFLAGLLSVTVWTHFRWMLCRSCNASLVNHLQMQTSEKPICYCPYCGADLNEP